MSILIFTGGLCAGVLLGVALTLATLWLSVQMDTEDPGAHRTGRFTVDELRRQVTEERHRAATAARHADPSAPTVYLQIGQRTVRV